MVHARHSLLNMLCLFSASPPMSGSHISSTGRATDGIPACCDPRSHIMYQRSSRESPWCSLHLADRVGTCLASMVTRHGKKRHWTVCSCSLLPAYWLLLYDKWIKPAPTWNQLNLHLDFYCRCSVTVHKAGDSRTGRRGAYDCVHCFGPDTFTVPIQRYVFKAYSAESLSSLPAINSVINKQNDNGKTQYQWLLSQHWLFLCLKRWPRAKLHNVIGRTS